MLNWNRLFKAFLGCAFSIRTTSDSSFSLIFLHLGLLTSGLLPLKTNFSFLIQNRAAERTTSSIHQLVPKLHSFSMLVLFLLKLMRIITWRQISSPLCPRNHSLLKMKSDIHLIINPYFLRYWESFWGKLKDISGNRKKETWNILGYFQAENYWCLKNFRKLKHKNIRKTALCFKTVNVSFISVSHYRSGLKTFAYMHMRNTPKDTH